jgi:hypothetical protein
MAVMTAAPNAADATLFTSKASGLWSVREELVMSVLVKLAAVVIAAVSMADNALIAMQTPASAIKVCGLLPRAEVKKLIDGDQVFDLIPPKEEALSTYGSSCSYPGVHIQVMSFLPSTIEAARKRGKLDTVAGVGDEAYLYENPAGYAELYVKVGPYLLTLQRRVGTESTVADVRPGVLALANALVEKLR